MPKLCKDGKLPISRMVNPLLVLDCHNVFKVLFVIQVTLAAIFLAAFIGFLT